MLFRVGEDGLDVVDGRDRVADEEVLTATRLEVLSAAPSEGEAKSKGGLQSFP